MSKLSFLLSVTGVGLILTSVWMLLAESRDPANLIELTWEVPADAEVGRVTPTPILVTNLSGQEARVVGLNHC